MRKTMKTEENKTCSTCRFWKQVNWLMNDEDGETPVGQCNAPMVYRGQGYWQEEGRDETKTMLSNGVMQPEEGGCTGMFITGPDFGCIHFKPNASVQSQAERS